MFRCGLTLLTVSKCDVLAHVLFVFAHVPLSRTDLHVQLIGVHDCSLQHITLILKYFDSHLAAGIFVQPALLAHIWSPQYLESARIATLILSSRALPAAGPAATSHCKLLTGARLAHTPIHHTCLWRAREGLCTPPQQLPSFAGAVKRPACVQHNTHPQPATMQHAVFTHQYHQQQQDWQHHGGGPQQHAPSQHQYGHSQSAAGLAQQQQQQHYGRMNQNGNGNGGVPQGLNPNRDNDSIFNPDNSISEENRKVLEWISQVLNANTRESALLELSKKREQVPELALILWHSFGMDIVARLMAVADC